MALRVTPPSAAKLVQKYGVRDVIGHDDISPGRKGDPGPAFPMRSFRSKVMGRSDDDEQVFYTTSALNIRVGPGSQHGQAIPEPTPRGNAG